MLLTFQKGIKATADKVQASDQKIVEAAVQYAYDAMIASQILGFTPKVMHG